MSIIHCFSRAFSTKHPIREDSLLPKVISCLPITGYLVSLAIRVYLEQRIRAVREEIEALRKTNHQSSREIELCSRSVDLICVKNKYLLMNSISFMLTIALYVAGVALHIFPLMSPLISLPVLTVCGLLPLFV